LGWVLCFLIIGIPILHFGLNLSLMRIAILAAIACASQLMFVPWLYSARATSQNPQGFVLRRAAAVLGWLSLMTLSLFCYLQSTWPDNPRGREARIILSVSLAVIVIFLIAAVAITRDSIRNAITKSRLFSHK
jgi:hypothetical protein